MTARKQILLLVVLVGTQLACGDNQPADSEALTPGSPSNGAGHPSTDAGNDSATTAHDPEPAVIVHPTRFGRPDELTEIVWPDARFASLAEYHVELVDDSGRNLWTTSLVSPDDRQADGTYRVELPELVDGSYYVVVTARDANNAVLQHVHIDLIVDGTAPRLRARLDTTATPEDERCNTPRAEEVPVFESASVVLNYCADDDPSGVSSVCIRVNRTGEPTPPSDDSCWQEQSSGTAAVELLAGENQVVIYGRDRAGNVGSVALDAILHTSCQRGYARQSPGEECLRHGEACEPKGLDGEPLAHGQGSWFYGKCRVTGCEDGYHANDDATNCIPSVRSCAITHGRGEQRWLGTTWSSCAVIACRAGFHAENSRCIVDQRRCNVANGWGQQSWEDGSWSPCRATHCRDGYEPQEAACVAIRCRPHDYLGKVSCVEEIRGSSTALKEKHCNASGDHYVFGSCILEACAAGYHENTPGNACVANLCEPNAQLTPMDCSRSIAHAVKAERSRSCNASGSGYLYGECTVLHCGDHFVSTGSSCRPRPDRPYDTLVNDEHTLLDCIASDGELYPLDDDVVFCRFDAQRCPDGWHPFRDYSATSRRTIRYSHRTDSGCG
jgi:hypothetical protein